MKYIIIFLISMFSVVYAQTENRYAGIEIGAKGIKISVIDITDINIGKFDIVKFWTRNTTVTRMLASTGKLDEKDIKETAIAVNEIIENQLKTEFALQNDHIFVVASSGCAMASNKQDLAQKIEELCGKKIEFISSELEGKLVTKGSIPSFKYDKSLIIDIGSGNTKGGYVLNEDGYYYFFPVAAEIGTITLTEKIKVKCGTSTDIETFKTKLTGYTDSLHLQIKNMFDNKPAARLKSNVYIIGGCVWAMSSLINPGNKDPYVQFTYKQIETYYDDLLNNFQKFNPDNQLTEFAKKDYNKVYETFTRESLLSGAAILLQTLKDIDAKDKNIYFVRQGHVAWIIAYTIDYLRIKKGIKKTY